MCAARWRKIGSVGTLIVEPGEALVPAKNGKDIVYLHYTGMSTKTATPETIVAYDAAAAELEEGAAVLYGDGRTEWLEPIPFKKALEEAKKKAVLQNAAP